MSSSWSTEELVTATLRGFSAPDVLSGRYDQRCRICRVSIESNLILPLLSELIVAVNQRQLEVADPFDFRLSADARSDEIASALRTAVNFMTEPDDVETALASAAYIDLLGRLSLLYVDRGRLRAHLRVAIQSGQISAVCSLLLMVGLIPLALHFGVPDTAIPTWAAVAGSVLVIATAIAWCAYTARGIMHRNQLSRLFVKYPPEAEHA